MYPLGQTMPRGNNQNITFHVFNSTYETILIFKILYFMTLMKYIIYILHDLKTQADSKIYVYQ